MVNLSAIAHESGSGMMQFILPKMPAPESGVKAHRRLPADCLPIAWIEQPDS